MAKSHLSQYTLEALRDPKIYKRDRALRDVAHNVLMTIEQRRGTFYDPALRQAVYGGEYAELVLAEIRENEARPSIMDFMREQAETVIEGMQVPAEYTVQSTAGHIELRGPCDEGLHPRLQRLGAKWRGQAPESEGRLMIGYGWEKSLDRALFQLQLERDIKREIRMPPGYWLQTAEEQIQQIHGPYRHSVDTLLEPARAQWSKRGYWAIGYDKVGEPQGAAMEMQRHLGSTGGKKEEPLDRRKQGLARAPAPRVRARRGR